MHQSTGKAGYTAPTISDMGSLHELTQTIVKHSDHVPDGYEYATPTGALVILTS